MERTLTILKPDTVQAGNAGAVLTMLEREGFRIRASKMVRLSQEEAQGFYDVHRERPFFQSLVTFMTEGPVIVITLEADNAIERLRKVMGATESRQSGRGHDPKTVWGQHRAQRDSRVRCA